MRCTSSLNAFGPRPLEEWQARFDVDGSIGYELFRHPDDVPQHPQVVHERQLRAQKDGRWRLASPWKVSGELHAIEEDVEASPVPIDSARPVWNEPERSMSLSSVPSVATAFPSTGELLQDVTIVEMGSYLAGPYAGRLLADYGARVIKIEPVSGDPFRVMNEGKTSLSSMWGKESIAINLKEPFGQEVLEKLLRKADVLFHNFRPGVPERTGFGWERAHELNPQLVYLSAFPFGSSGPLMGRPAYDPILSVASGCALRQSGGLFPSPTETVAFTSEELPEQVRRVFMTTPNVGDPTAGIMVATAVIYGLLARERSGEGCNLETTMLGSALYANSEVFDRRLPFDAEISREGLGLSPLYRLYKVRDGWVFLAAASETTWRALSRTYLGDDPLGTLTFAQAWLSKDLNIALERRLADEARDNLEPRFLAAGVPCVGVVEQRFDAILQPWLRDVGMVGQVSDRVAGSYLRYGRPIAQQGDFFPDRGAPLVGEQTGAILEELGYSAAEIATAQEQNTVVCWNPLSDVTA